MTSSEYQNLIKTVHLTIKPWTVMRMCLLKNKYALSYHKSPKAYCFIIGPKFLFSRISIFTTIFYRHLLAFVRYLSIRKYLLNWRLLKNLNATWILLLNWEVTDGNINLFIIRLMHLTQLPGRLFSPSDISKKLSHRFLLHFWIDIGSYDHHAKYQGVFMGLL